MAVRWLPTTVLVLGFGAAVYAEGPEPSPLPLPPPAFAEDATPPDTPPVLLPVPPGTSQPCRTCPHPYLPDRNPDCRTIIGYPGDCDPPPLGWVDLAVFAGKADNLPYVDRKFLYGFQADGGYWFSPDRCVGVQLGLFSVHGAYRSERTGPLLVDSPVTLTTADASIRTQLVTDGRMRVDGLAGYRYGYFHEKDLLGNWQVQTNQRAKNQIHAGQFGAAVQSRYGAYFVEVVMKVAAGTNAQSIEVDGLAFTRQATCIIPELSAQCGYQLGEGLWATMGYRAVYLSNVYRPTRGQTDFFLQGLLLGLEKQF